MPTNATQTAHQVRKAQAIYNLLVRATDVDTDDLGALSDAGWSAAAALAWELQPTDRRPAVAWTGVSDATRGMVRMLFQAADIAGDGRPELVEYPVNPDAPDEGADVTVAPARHLAAVPSPAGDWTPVVGDEVTPREGRGARTMVGTVVAVGTTAPGQRAEVAVAWPTGRPGKGATVRRWELAADLAPAGR